MSIEQVQNERIDQLENQIDKATALFEKLNKEKAYLIDLLIKDTSPSTTAIINKYLDWLEENEK